MKISVNLNDKDIIKLVIEFLANRELNISMLDLERETGVINGEYSDDILFLRQLILDGQWDDALEFIQPLKQIELFNSKHFHFLIMKYQYLELLCLKTEANVNEVNQLSVEQLVAYLNELRPFCPSEDEYKKLCLLLTSSRLQDHNEFKTWNPSSGRLQCFKEILPLVNKFLSGESGSNNKFISSNERLVQLIVKGVLYESCVEYCQAKATQSTEAYNLNDPNILLMQMQLSETDASLLSWLHALPSDTFSCPFEEKPLKLSLNKFIKPNLEATWADVILATPIKPEHLFPYNAVPIGRSRNTELMSRSLAPQYDGLSFGLNKSQIFTSGIEIQLEQHNHQQGMNSDQMNNNSSQPKKKSQYQRDLNDLTRSIALFNLEMPNSQPFFSKAPESNLTNINRIHQPTVLNEIKEEEITSLKNENNEIDEEEEDEQFSQRMKIKKTSLQSETNIMSDSVLFKQYQKNKANTIQQLEEQEKRREEFIKELKAPNLNEVFKPNKNNSSKTSLNGTDPILSPNKQNQNNKSFDSNQDLKFSFNNNNNNNNKTEFHESSLSPKSQENKPNNSSINNIKTTINQKKENSISASSLGNHYTKYDSLEDITRTSAFLPICTIEDQQAIRAVDIHPSGDYFVVGSNSKCLRVCSYPSLNDIKFDVPCKPASVLYKRSKHHYGSIYCTAWNASGNLIATGSNDKTIKLLKFTPNLIEENDSEIELSYHNGTVRDLIFMQQEDNNILISGGAGDCKIHVFDCQTQQSLRVYSGHCGHIYTLCTWSGTKNVFVSGSQDQTCRFWDLRTPEAIQKVAPSTTVTLQGSPVASVAVDPSGLLLSSGHEDAACCLYDIRGSRIVQTYKPHTSDIRSVRFSANAYFLLSASYDNKVIITDLHGDLTKPLKWSIVASHNDKIIQARWHPSQMSFITTSADRTSTVWSLPTNFN